MAAFISRSRAILIAVFLGILGGGMLLGGISTFRILDRPPLVFLSSRMLDPAVEEDGDIRFLVRVKSTLTRDCAGSITREFYQPVEIDGQILREKHRASGPVPIVHEGESAYVINMPLPPRLKPGAWTFQGETTYYCGILWGGTKRFRIPELPFTIVPKGTLSTSAATPTR